MCLNPFSLIVAYESYYEPGVHVLHADHKMLFSETLRGVFGGTGYLNKNCSNTGY